ncbi:unnamed protein product, partial [Oppiella nova]
METSRKRITLGNTHSGDAIDANEWCFASNHFLYYTIDGNVGKRFVIIITTKQTKTCQTDSESVVIVLKSDANSESTERTFSGLSFVFVIPLERSMDQNRDESSGRLDEMSDRLSGLRLHDSDGNELGEGTSCLSNGSQSDV